MRYRPIERDPDDQRLGRFIPDDWHHVESYPLTARTRPVHVPVVIGVNWYAEFDEPEPDRRGVEFVARGGPASLTAIRGGHAVCLEPGGEPDQDEWWEFYDQGSEGACVGFAWSRCMSILNKEIYTARWLWDRAKERDQWAETNPGDDNGTSCRAAAEVLASAGHVDWDDSFAGHNHTRRSGYVPDAGDGIKVFRWARSVDEVHSVLGNARADELGAVPFLNSWGTGYPHRVWMPDEVFDRLIREDGEIAVPTDH
ncbi:hypothetical protein HUO13_25470 [Saccharopolyspora erythraea]|uniref:hypothetical protein n=1 Tax=Saccharopolyspora erythraea TaxID=1836 RepID=UPI001BABCADB|nr:hypothetical protein [Saccharopolyspora erythraea]QUH03723.1 hypothetical protein HUO13_25470 [Saccharopolyspora erythraea]